MRFEIGPGGGFVILVGLLGLSAAVFFLGMISGREMAQSEQGQTQLASVYPMPGGAPPPVASAPVTPPPHVAEPAAPSSAAPIAAATARPPSRVASESIPSAALPAAPNRPAPHPALANVSPAHPSASAAEELGNDSSSDSSDERDTGTDGRTASAPSPADGTHHKGYNIVIDAAMDHAAATRMAARLLGLGYTSHVLPSQIDGQTWYRVQVGPYSTSNEARAAQAQLREAYTARYVNHTGAANLGAAGGSSSGKGAASARSTDTTDTSDSGAAESDTDDSAGASAPTAPTD
jgi:hypothetical protein